MNRLDPTKHPANPAPTLLIQLGGPSALDALVGAFYFNILRDARVAGFFAHTDVDAVRRHQRAFLEAALGGASHYQGRDLTTAHRQLVQNEGLRHSHFDAMADVLASTLRQLGHPIKLRQQILAEVRALAPAVFGVSEEPPN